MQTGKKIDCFFIGHNQASITQLEMSNRMFGTDSNNYKDVNLSFVSYKKELYSVSDMFSLVYYGDSPQKDSFGYLNIGENFSNTIAYLASYLHRRGYTYDFINSFNNSREELAQKLGKNNILTIAITTTFYVSAYYIIDIVSFIKKHNSTARIIVGGPYIAYQIRNQTKSALDSIFKRIGADFYIDSLEGERSLVELIEAIKTGSDYEKISNVYFDKNGEYCMSCISIEDNELDSNMIDWSLFSGRMGNFVNIRTSKYCPFSCAFCTFQKATGKHEQASVESIESELDLLNKYNPSAAISFTDDTFNIPPERFKRILRMMIKNKYKFKWQSFFRCQYADRETVELMKESGCESVFLGIESGSQKILDNMNKSASVDSLRNGLALINEYDICSNASFIIGFPGETLDTYQETYNFIEECKPTFFRVNMWLCHPDSPIYDKAEKYSIKGLDTVWSHDTMDADTARMLSEELYFSVKNSVGIKSFEFETEIVFHMIRRGLSVHKIKAFFNSFNKLVYRKIKNETESELKSEDIEFLRNLLKY